MSPERYAGSEGTRKIGGSATPGRSQPAEEHMSLLRKDGLLLSCDV
jgi:hypothetical protein